MSDQQRLYARARKAVEKAAHDRRASVESAWEQIEAEALRRGSLMPTPGKDI